MKIPLHYQISEYDCGPTSMLNAISFLFEREDIPPELIRNIMLYSLDCYGSEGGPGKSGTSRAAMMFLSNWLNGFGDVGLLNVSSKYLSGKSVYIGQQSYINDALTRGGAAVVRLFLDEPHYVTLTGLDVSGNLLIFDPYLDDELTTNEIIITRDHPCEYNRIVPADYFNLETETLYAFGPFEGREAVLVFNNDTKITSEETIEYFI